MPRLPAMLLAALAGTAHAPWGGMDQNLLDCEYDLPQHACPTCEGAPLGLAGGMPDAVVALTPRCIEAEGGCCEHDGFEYFLKASLARYQSGNVVSFFYPGKADMVSWVARDDADCRCSKWRWLRFDMNSSCSPKRPAQSSSRCESTGCHCALTP